MADIMAAEIRSRPAHRKEFNDIQWRAAQPYGKAAFHLGDAVEVYDGSFGVVVKVSECHDGWSATYALDPIEGYAKPPYHAWFCEGDFKRLVGPSPLRQLIRKAARSLK